MIALSASLAGLGEGATQKVRMEAVCAPEGRHFDEGWMVAPGIAFEMTEGDAKFFAECANRRAEIVAALRLAEAVDSGAPTAWALAEYRSTLSPSVPK